MKNIVVFIFLLLSVVNTQAQIIIGGGPRPNPICEEFFGVGTDINGIDTTRWLYMGRSVVPEREEECEDLLVVIDNDTIIGDYSYFKTRIQDSGDPALENYHFSLDMDSLLTSFNPGNKVTFFKVITEYQGIIKTIAKLKLTKKMALGSETTNGYWQLNVVWYNLNSSAKTMLDYILDINNSDLDINFEWNDGSLWGGAFGYQTSKITINESIVTTNPYSVTDTYRPDEINIGFINTNHELDDGDIMKFRLPVTQPEQ